MSDTDRDKLARIIREAVMPGTDGDADSRTAADAILAEFLPEHDKQVKADAWDEGAAACWDGNDMQYPNPYRKGQS